MTLIAVARGFVADHVTTSGNDCSSNTSDTLTVDHSNGNAATDDGSSKDTLNASAAMLRPNDVVVANADRSTLRAVIEAVSVGAESCCVLDTSGTRRGSDVTITTIDEPLLLLSMPCMNEASVAVVLMSKTVVLLLTAELMQFPRSDGVAAVSHNDDENDNEDEALVCDIDGTFVCVSVSN
jgi:hypothetical protein